MVNKIRETEPDAKLVYNNSPSFNWTLAFREQVYEEWVAAGKDVAIIQIQQRLQGSYGYKI